MAQTNKFLVSVANAIGRDPNTGAGIFFGKANISSALTISTQKVEVRGSIGNPLLYNYFHSRNVEVKIESAVFTKTFLGLNVGQLTQTGVVNTVQTECVTLVNNVGAVTLTPLSDIVAFMNDGTIQNLTPTGKTFTTVGGGATSIDVVYTVATTADQIVVSATTPPSVVDLTLIAEVRDNTGVITEYLQVAIPSFQISGNYTLSLAANGVSNESLDGFALAVNATDCTTGNYFARVTWVPVATAAVATSSIVAIPSSLVFPTGAAGTKTINVLAIKGTSNVNVTTSASYTTSGSVFVAGLHTGLISVSASSAGVGYSGSAWVNYYDSVSGSSFNDFVNLVVG
jgi:hypothetical protein